MRPREGVRRDDRLPHVPASGPRASRLADLAHPGSRASRLRGPAPARAAFPLPRSSLFPGPRPTSCRSRARPSSRSRARPSSRGRARSLPAPVSLAAPPPSLPSPGHGRRGLRSTRKGGAGLSPGATGSPGGDHAARHPLASGGRPAERATRSHQAVAGGTRRAQGRFRDRCVAGRRLAAAAGVTSSTYRHAFRAAAARARWRGSAGAVRRAVGVAAGGPPRRWRGAGLPERPHPLPGAGEFPLRERVHARGPFGGRETGGERGSEAWKPNSPAQERCCGDFSGSWRRRFLYQEIVSGANLLEPTSS